MEVPTDSRKEGFWRVYDRVNYDCKKGFHWAYHGQHVAECLPTEKGRYAFWRGRIPPCKATCTVPRDSRHVVKLIDNSKCFYPDDSCSIDAFVDAKCANGFYAQTPPKMSKCAEVTGTKADWDPPIPECMPMCKITGKDTAKPLDERYCDKSFCRGGGPVVFKCRPGYAIHHYGDNWPICNVTKDEAKWDIELPYCEEKKIGDVAEIERKQQEKYGRQKQEAEKKKSTAIIVMAICIPITIIAMIGVIVFAGIKSRQTKDNTELDPETGGTKAEMSSKKTKKSLSGDISGSSDEPTDEGAEDATRKQSLVSEKTKSVKGKSKTGASQKAQADIKKTKASKSKPPDDYESLIHTVTKDQSTVKTQAKDEASIKGTKTKKATSERSTVMPKLARQASKSPKSTRGASPKSARRNTKNSEAQHTDGITPKPKRPSKSPKAKSVKSMVEKSRAGNEPGTQWAEPKTRKASASPKTKRARADAESSRFEPTTTSALTQKHIVSRSPKGKSPKRSKTAK